MSTQTFRIGLAGLGTVGAGTARNLARNATLLSARSGFSFEITRVVARDPSKPRPDLPPTATFSTQPADLTSDPSIHIIVELMGGIQAPRQLILDALKAGKPVVTGNKALLAEHGAEIFHAASATGTPLFYEAAVAGGIPIIQAVRDGFIASRLELIQGILNGTSNYILTRMEQDALSFSAALQEAQRLGYAEADPSLDINGWDAAHKAIILASLACGQWVPPSAIHVQGIQSLTAEDIRFARTLGYAIKLLASIRSHPSTPADPSAPALSVRVCPTLIPINHVLASVSGVFNAIWLRGDIVGESLFYGRGAGPDPTSSAVIADIVEAARWLCHQSRAGSGFAPSDRATNTLPPGHIRSGFYLRLMVEDRPGVLAQIAGILGDASIGISSVIQPESPSSENPGAVPLVLMIHEAAAAPMHAAAAQIAALPCVKAPPQCLPVERPPHA